MHSRWLFLVVIFFGAATILPAQTSPFQNNTLPFGSVSTSDDIWSLLYNPAGLGISRGFQFFYLHSYNDSSFDGDNGLFASLGKLGFSVEWFGNNSTVSYRRYTLAQGISLSKKVHLGTGYSWFGSNNQDYDKLSSWSLGLLVRPNQFLSYGFKASELNRPAFMGQREHIKFNYGLALRPKTDRITLAVEGITHEKQSFFADADFLFQAEAEIAPGLFLQGKIDDKGDNFFLGGKINLPNFSLGSLNFFHKKEGLQSGVTYLGLSSQRHSTILQRKNNFLVMGLGGQLPEEARRGGFRSKSKTLRQVLETIEKAKKDNAVSGLVVKIDPLDCGLGKIQELRNAFLDFKTSQKNLIVFMEVAGTKEYYLASVADKIIMLPSGYLDFAGLTAQVTFLKGTLDKLGIVADLEHVGKYKSASDLLTRDSMSEAHQEVVNSVLDDIFDQITAEIATDRGWTPELVKQKVDQGPFTANEAFQAGLVDKLAFPDEIEEIINHTPRKKLSLFETRPVLISEKSYISRKEYEQSWKVPPKIAVIYVTGMITSGGSGSDLIFGNTVGSQSIVGSIRQAKNDNSVKAIVLRVDSPGGSGLASDLIWRELQLAKKKKPVFVSMSDYAASGGYFVSIPGEEILSNPGTLTGSIGVITGKFSLAGLYKKIGVNIQIQKRGEHPDIFTASRSFTDQERVIVRRQVNEFYTDFIGKVAQGRNLDTAYVDSIAQGRVWTGRQAKQNRLVDRFGGLAQAIQLAKSKAGITGDQEVEIVALPTYRSPWPFGLDRALWFLEDLNQLQQIWKGDFSFENERIFYLSPYEIKVE
jgi:protease-4